MSRPTLHRGVRSTLLTLTIGAWMVPEVFAQTPGPSLDPASIPKYTRALVIPPAVLLFLRRSAVAPVPA